MTDKEIQQELDAIEDDKQKNLMQLAAQQRQFAEMLRSSMGEDIMNVLTGKVKVELTEEEKKKHKKNKFWNKIKNFLSKWN